VICVNDGALRFFAKIPSTIWPRTAPRFRVVGVAYVFSKIVSKIPFRARIWKIARQTGSFPHTTNVRTPRGAGDYFGTGSFSLRVIFYPDGQLKYIGCRRYSSGPCRRIPKSSSDCVRGVFRTKTVKTATINKNDPSYKFLYVYIYIYLFIIGSNKRVRIVIVPLIASRPIIITGQTSRRFFYARHWVRTTISDIIRRRRATAERPFELVVVRSPRRNVYEIISVPYLHGRRSVPVK